jgi:hypothetical protein
MLLKNLCTIKILMKKKKFEKIVTQKLSLSRFSLANYGFWIFQAWNNQDH